jgi:hypothetical protein
MPLQEPRPQAEPQSSRLRLGSTHEDSKVTHPSPTISGTDTFSAVSVARIFTRVMSDIKPKISLISNHYLVSYKSFRGSRDNSVGIGTRLRAGRPKTRSSTQMQEIFLYFITSRQVLEPAQPTVQFVLSAFCYVIKRQKRESYSSHLPLPRLGMRRVASELSVLHGIRCNYVQ